MRLRRIEIVDKVGTVYTRIGAEHLRALRRNGYEDPLHRLVEDARRRATGSVTLRRVWVDLETR